MHIVEDSLIGQVSSSISVFSNKSESSLIQSICDDGRPVWTSSVVELNSRGDSPTKFDPFSYITVTGSCTTMGGALVGRRLYLFLYTEGTNSSEGFFRIICCV